MDVNFKDFQLRKLKNYFKNNEFFFLCNSTKLSITERLKTKQNFNKMQLSLKKPQNKIAAKAVKNSIYQRFRPIIESSVLFVTPVLKTSQFAFPSVAKMFEKSFLLLGVKLNNQIYASSQLKGLTHLSYKKNMFVLHKTLDKYLKITYAVTKTRQSK